MEPAIIVHGGAGYFPDARNAEKIEVVKRAVREAYNVLRLTDDPVDAVERAVRIMEDDVCCNAGYGSVLTREGEVEMDAIIIRGSNLATGGVGAVKHVRNPISLARLVMEKSKHALLVGQGAEDFAKQEGCEIVETSELVCPRALNMLQAVLAMKMAPATETGGSVVTIAQDPKTETGASVEDDDNDDEAPEEGGLGTVGAVAINSRGQLAAATSTGGLCGKLPGRVGDTPIPGGGTYCDDDSCGISATGLGEAIMKVCLCSRIANLVDKGLAANEACLTGLNDMTSKIPEGDGGAIIITKSGEVGHQHNSQKMTWASIQGNELRCGLQKGEEFVEEFLT